MDYIPNEARCLSPSENPNQSGQAASLCSRMIRNCLHSWSASSDGAGWRLIPSRSSLLLFPKEDVTRLMWFILLYFSDAPYGVEAKNYWQNVFNQVRWVRVKWGWIIYYTLHPSRTCKLAHRSAREICLRKRNWMGINDINGSYSLSQERKGGSVETKRYLLIVIRH